MTAGQYPVADKRALITGGTAGLGLAMARALLAGGARVIVTGRGAGRGAAAFLRHDAADEASWNEVLGTVEARWGGFDVLVNNVGVNVVRAFADTGHADFVRLGASIGLQPGSDPFVAATLIARSGGGAVINIGSMAARYANATVAPYCSAKAFVAALSRAAAAHFATSGVRVNTIHPGIFPTELTERTAFNDAANRAAQIVRIPIGRFGDPAGLGPLCRFLISAVARGVSGSEFVVDGGRTER